MEFRVLGVVELVADEVPIDLGRRWLERSILGLLLLHLNSSISVDRFTDLLWNEDLPPRPRQALQVSVSRLRARLAAADVERHGFGSSPGAPAICSKVIRPWSTCTVSGHCATGLAARPTPRPGGNY